ncbi:MAG: hypothetical protein DRI44_03095 [Chlamydiae bacterium]|nr:MAG: hypothetical protein DRI44_03095 [Chlamydiota bacterium]
MKKIILGIIFLFIATVLVTPFFVGIAAEKTINKQIDKMAQTANISISNVYKRNWFSSHANTIFNLSQLLPSLGLTQLDSISGLTNISVKIRSEIIHGPFTMKRFYSKQPLSMPVLGVIKSHITILFPPDILNFAPAITAYTSIFPNGSASGVFSIPGINYTDNITDQSLISGNISGETGLAKKGTILYLNFHTPKILLENHKNSAEIKGLNCSWHNSKGAKGISAISFGLRINSLTTGKTKIDKIFFSSTKKEKSGNLFFNAKLSIMAIKDENTNFGPVKIGLNCKNIKKDVYLQLLSLANDAKKEPENQFARVLLMAQIMGLLPELLAESPEINLEEFKIGTPTGNILINANIKAGNSKIVNPNNLKKIIKSINANFTMTIPDSIAEKYIFSNDNPRSVMLQKMMIRNNNNYTLNLKYINSLFFVNGKPFSADDRN